LWLCNGDCKWDIDDSLWNEVEFVIVMGVSSQQKPLLSLLEDPVGLAMLFLCFLIFVVNLNFLLW
jgi:hypothetical protein